MGSYLSQPVTDKESCYGRGRGHVWGCSAMQGWRTGMEDAHIAVSGLGDELDELSLFGVFDGHGGAEVAAFCKQHLPDEIRRQLRKRLADGARLSGDVLGEALISAFHAMDDMLRSPEHERQLLALKQAVRPSAKGIGAAASSSSGSSSDSGSSSGSDSEAEEKEDGKKPRGVLSLLSNSIQSTLEQARDKGSLSREEAKQVMMKMALLRRLESKAPSLSSDAAAADNVGCTAVCVLLSDTEIVCANAGDSRAVLCRGGSPVELSHDHKPNEAGERERIEAAGGRIEEIPVGARVHYRVNGNLNLSRSIGDLEYKKQPALGHERQMICSTPDIVKMALNKEDDFIALACDGVWDVKTNADVCSFVKKRLAAGEEIVPAVEALLDDCIAEDPKKASLRFDLNIFKPRPSKWHRDHPGIRVACNTTSLQAACYHQMGAD
ncbi:ptc2 [Symbiodinium pilosum]|uniref:Ptc2 protein n=1 Tax=Symbiodinium pilosum TaxID=2952 RepID=A0A812LQD7_SYMPI|nr:ptc2 [Symbiodinium pilosum]